MFRRQNEILKYIELFFLIVLTVGPFPPIAKMVLYFFVLLMNLKEIHLLLCKKGVEWFHIFLIFSIIIPMALDIRNIDSSTSYALSGFAFFAPFVFCLVYTLAFEKNEFLYKLEQVIFVITIISIIGFSITSFIPSIIDSFPTVSFYGRKVYTIGIYGAIHDFSATNFLSRNCGIAFEPGAFQFIPNLGLALLFCFKGKERNLKFWLKILIYTISVLTTYSSTGIIVLSLIIIIGSFSNRKQFFLMFLTIAILNSVFLTSIQYQIGKMETGNFSERFEPTIRVLQNYSQHIFGIGSTGYDKEYSLNPMIGSWDTFSNMYLRFGLPFTAFLIFMCARLCKLSPLICLTVVLSFMTESLIGPITVMLFYYAIQPTNEIKNKTI